MQRLATLGVEAAAQLQERAGQADIVFADAGLPEGCQPAIGRIGVRVADGRVQLLVDRHIHYRGDDAQVRQWITEGQRSFATMAELAAWALEVSGPRRPEGVTDLARAGMEVSGRGKEEPAHADALVAAVSSRIRGQDAAVRVLCGTAARHLARRHPRRPASIFAVGNSGVGKTASVEALAAALVAARRGSSGPDPSGSAPGFLRIDLSEYHDRHRTAQLLGAPPGYVGHDRPSPLASALVSDPRGVVLFDEVDKAHPDVLTAIMNLLDAGRLSTPTPIGPDRVTEIDARGAILCFTSNRGADAILEQLDGRRQPALIDQVCRRQLRTDGIAPELVGRIGAFAVFDELGDEARVEIAVLGIMAVAREYGLVVTWIEPVVIGAVLDAAGDSGLGARADEHAADRLLGDAFARAAAAGLARVTLDLEVGDDGPEPVARSVSDHSDEEETG